MNGLAPSRAQRSIYRGSLLLTFALAILFSIAGTGTARATFAINYSDAAGFGFNDATLGAERKTAFEYATNIWNSLLPSTYTSPIVIDASWSSSLPSGVLGSTYGFNNAYADFPGCLLPDTWYPDTLADYLHGSDLGSGHWDMQMQFSTTFSWYYPTNGTTGNIGANYDFASVVLHEIGHGMGMTGLFDSTGQWYINQFPYMPMVYDTFLEDTAGTQLISKPIAASNVTSPVYWDGPHANAANGGDRVQLYAPSTFDSGSSIYHLNYPTYADDLMNPFLGANTVNHQIDPLTIGMLEDMGWDFQDAASTPEPASIVLLMTSGAFAMVIRRKRRQS